MKSLKFNSGSLNPETMLDSSKPQTGQFESTPQVLTALREATGQTHKAVEKLTPFFRADFGRPSYLRWLDLMHGFYRVVDRTVDQSSFITACGWHYAARCELIAQDLAFLADRPPEDPADPTGILAPLQTFGTSGEVAGMLYVVEGSSLGSKVLLGVLGKSTGVTAASGASFFAPNGDNPLPRWVKYVQLLKNLSCIPGNEQDVVHGARTTFTVLHNWILKKWVNQQVTG
jgi:heme oxygenase